MTNQALQSKNSLLRNCSDRELFGETSYSESHPRKCTTTITLVKNFLYFMNSPNYHCLKSIQIRSFSCPFFLRSKSPYLVRIQEITDQKKFRIWTLCMQCTVGKLQISTFINNERGGCTFVHLTQCFLINITAASSLK